MTTTKVKKEKKPQKKPEKKPPKKTEKKPTKKLEKKPEKKPEKKKKKRITIEYTKPENELDENKYSEKVKSILNKIKNQTTDVDKSLRFCWKN